MFENSKKVSFKIASEASYVYIRQKFIKKAKNSQFEKLKRANSVTRQVNFNIGQKLVENPKIEKFNWDILGDFQTLW